MNRLMLSLMLILSFATPAVADAIVGAIDGAYTFAADGYWWSGSNAYVRTWTAGSPGYYRCGYYYPGSAGYWSYSYSHAKPAVTYQSADWKTKLLELAEQRDKYEGQIRKGAFEQQWFLQAVESLGLKGNFAIQGYGAAAPYGSYGNGFAQSYGSELQLSSAGVNASTIYGYQSIASLYGDSSINQLYQQANRLAEHQQSLSADATAQFGDLIGKEGMNRARVAEILAKGQAVREFLSTIDGSKLESKTLTFKVTPEGKVEKTDDGAIAAQLQTQWKASAQACAGCHSGANLKGGFDVARYPTLALNDPMRLKVIARLTHSDETKRMPRKADGTAGPRMNLDEIGLWAKVR